MSSIRSNYFRRDFRFSKAFEDFRIATAIIGANRFTTYLKSFTKFPSLISRVLNAERDANATLFRYWNVIFAWVRCIFRAVTISATIISVPSGVVRARELRRADVYSARGTRYTVFFLPAFVFRGA